LRIRKNGRSAPTGRRAARDRVVIPGGIRRTPSEPNWRGFAVVQVARDSSKSAFAVSNIGASCVYAARIAGSGVPGASRRRFAGDPQQSHATSLPNSEHRWRASPSFVRHRRSADCEPTEPTRGTPGPVPSRRFAMKVGRFPPPTLPKCALDSAPFE